MKNIKKYRGIKLVTIKRRKNYLMLEPSYHTNKQFSDNLLA